MRILLRILDVFDWTRDGSAGTGRRMAVLAALLILAVALAGPVQAAPQLAQGGDAFDRMVARMEANNAMYRIIFEDHPAERRGFIQALRLAYRRGGQPAMNFMALRYGEHLGRKYFRYYMRRTSDAAALGYIRVMADTLAVLRIGSPDDCYAMLAGTTRERARVAGILNRHEKQRILRALGAVTLGSRQVKRRRAAPGAYRVPLAAVRARVAARLGRGNLVPWRPGLVGDDRAKACDHALAFFEEILKRPAREAAILTRAVFGGAVRPHQTVEN
jgi:hypothetical protein